jgi:hypothetical protein
MYAIYRVRQAKTNVIIVHRRVGRARIRSRYDKMYGGRGYWGTLCRHNMSEVNTTTKDEEVTCLHCLKRMS